MVDTEITYKERDDHIVGTVLFYVHKDLLAQCPDDADLRERLGEDVKRRVRKLLETPPAKLMEAYS